MGKTTEEPSLEIMAENQDTPGLEEDVLDSRPVVPDPNPAVPVSGEKDRPTNTQAEVPLKWFTRHTQKRILRALGECPNKTCRECWQECTSRKRLLVHARQHWTNMFCPCGEASYWRERITKHQARSQEPGRRCRVGVVYEVDAESFARWQKVTGTPVTRFPTTRPVVRVAPTEARKKRAQEKTDTPTSGRSTSSPVIRFMDLPFIEPCSVQVERLKEEDIPLPLPACSPPPTQSGIFALPQGYQIRKKVPATREVYRSPPSSAVTGPVIEVRTVQGEPETGQSLLGRQKGNRSGAVFGRLRPLCHTPTDRQSSDLDHHVTRSEDVDWLRRVERLVVQMQDGMDHARNRMEDELEEVQRIIREERRRRKDKK